MSLCGEALGRGLHLGLSYNTPTHGTHLGGFHARATHKPVMGLGHSVSHGLEGIHFSCLWLPWGLKSLNPAGPARLRQSRGAILWPRITASHSAWNPSLLPDSLCLKDFPASCYGDPAGVESPS